METRMLGSGDVAAYRAIRLRALKDHPEAFGMSPEEHEAMSDETVEGRLIDQLPESGIIGGFIDDELIGTIYVGRHHRQKTRHRASIDAMYIVPEQRTKGAGEALLNAGLDHIRGLDGVQQVVLAVTAGNVPAQRLYKKAGFQTWGVDPGSIRVGDVYHDVEWMVLWLLQPHPHES